MFLFFHQHQQDSHSQTVSSLTAELRDARQELREKTKEKKDADRAWQNYKADWQAAERKLKDSLERRDKLIEVKCWNLLPVCVITTPVDHYPIYTYILFLLNVANPARCWGAGPCFQRAAAELAEQTWTSDSPQTHTVIEDRSWNCPEIQGLLLHFLHHLFFFFWPPAYLLWCALSLFIFTSLIYIFKVWIYRCALRWRKVKLFTITAKLSEMNQ